MRVLHVISGLSRSSGGPSRSVQGLVAAECKAGVDAWVWPLSGGKPWVDGVRDIQCRLDDAEELRKAILGFDLVHIHGLWDLRLHKVAAACRRMGVKYIIAPRGMLEPWSLKQKWLKKRIARFLYQDGDLKGAAALHATAESESEQFRRLGFANRVIISPNGVNVRLAVSGNSKREDYLRRAQEIVDEWLAGVSTERFAAVLDELLDRKLAAGEYRFKGVTEVTFEASSKRRKAPRLMPLAEAVKTVVHRQIAAGSNPSTSKIIPKFSDSGKGVAKRVLFVSRMHPKKGVMELVEAWRRRAKVKVRGEGEEMWVCELVYTVNGDVEREYEEKVKVKVKELGLEDQFVFTGALNDDEKWKAYARADLFVLPTYSENFGIVVAEALWAGVPVITTKGTPWHELEGYANSQLTTHNSQLKCGWWIDTGVEPLAAALKDAMALSDEERAEMGKRGRQLVESKYTWDAVVKAMIAGYEEILNISESPCL